MRLSASNDVSKFGYTSDDLYRIAKEQQMVQQQQQQQQWQLQQQQQQRVHLSDAAGIATLRKPPPRGGKYDHLQLPNIASTSRTHGVDASSVVEAAGGGGDVLSDDGCGEGQPPRYGKSFAFGAGTRANYMGHMQ